MELIYLGNCWRATEGWHLAYGDTQKEAVEALQEAMGYWG